MWKSEIWGLKVRPITSGSKKAPGKILGAKTKEVCKQVME
jgi:hypothetical protein